MAGFFGTPLISERLFAAIRREVIRTMRMNHKPTRLGLVSSFDPQKHAVKVQFQPEGTESGWIPLTAVAIGNKFGIVFAPNIKDQVEVSFQEGDHMVAKVTTRHFSLQADQAPQVQAGEYHIIHGSGAVIRITQDGTLFIGGSGTVSTGQVGGGQSGNLSTGSQGTVANPSAQGSQQQPQKPQALQSMTFKPNGEIVINAPQNNITIETVQSVLVQASQNVTVAATADVNVTGNGNVTVKGVGSMTVEGGPTVNVTASSNVTVAAPTIPLEGNVLIG